MATIPANTTAFLTAVKARLSTDRTNGGVSLPPSYSFLAAQDMANVLRLLTAPLNTGTLTATGAGSTTTFVDGASTFVANTMIGNTVTFASNTTTVALRGVTATVRSNTTTTLTFNETLPAATQTGDTLTIAATFVNDIISYLMDGKDSLTAAPAGSYYSKMVQANSGLVKLIQQLGGTLPSRNLFTTTAIAGTSTTVVAVNTRGVKVIVDEFKNRFITVNSVKRRVISNTAEGLFTLDAPITAPSGGESVTITCDDTDINPFRVANFYSGAVQNGDNYKLADMITAAQAAVTAFTVPT